jgi:peptidoglycan/xylan/chitin deacetylase (PgdA/CDA1 family)
MTPFSYKNLLINGRCVLALVLAMAVIGGCVKNTRYLSSGALKGKLNATYADTAPTAWGETVTGVKTCMATDDNVVALTLDACGSKTGMGFDAELIRYLEKEKIPATLFINARWIDANRELFLKLANNPLFTIANHGFLHKPASVNGRSIYGIAGTGSVDDLIDEIGLNAEKIKRLTGKRPVYYRSGTAYYDELAIQLAERLGHQVIGFSVLGDAGATFSEQQVTTALLASPPGSIVILHMNHPECGTAKGVMAAVPEMRKRGVRFVRLADYPLRQGWPETAPPALSE